MSSVSIVNLKKSYREVIALADISLDIPSGSFFTLLGPSGCGKTTLLRAIAGFHQQDSGTISIGGNSIESIPVYKRNVGMVFQDYAIFPHMSVYNNVAFGLKQHKVPRKEIKERVAKILEVVQLSDFVNRMPHELSGGQQQRVGLARSLVTNPQVLLMDEPLSNLDAKLRIDLRRVLRSIQQSLGITTVYVTHDQEEALEMSDFICVMYQGVIQQSDTPWNIYNQPANRFVATFVGSNNFLTIDQNAGSMNILDQTLPQIIADKVAKNQESILTIRPEKMKVSFSPTTISDANMMELPLILERYAFVGRELNVVAKSASGEAVLAIAKPTAEIMALKEGDLIYYQFSTDDVLLFEGGENGHRYA